MAETVTLKGNPVTLAGPVVNVGDEAPVACVVKSDLSEKQIGGKKEKVQLIITVPSLDTPVCETETRKFNEMLKDLDVDVTVVSMDLPFAEKRFC
ncbi:redoxin family protein, partial [Thermovibrio ammonificans]